MTESKSRDLPETSPVTSMSRRKQLLFATMLLGFSLALALLLGEVAARVLGSPQGGTGEGGAGPSLYEHDPLLGWRKQPSVTVEVRTSEYEISEATNSLGLRGPETTRAKPEGTRRVLLLGDSFLEGYTVDAEDLVSTQLERLLNETNPEPVEVLNAGTAGYGTDQELLYFEREGLALEPDLTVVLFYVNDVYFNAHGSYWRGEKPYFEMTDSGPALRGVPVAPPDPDRYAFEVQGGTGIVALVRRMDAWLGTRSALHRLVRGAVVSSPTLSGLTMRLGFAEVPGEFKPWQRDPDPEIRHAWSVTEALLARLRQVAADGGSDLLVFYVPSRPAIYDDDWRRTRRAYAMDDGAWSPSADGDALSRICGRQGIDCIIPLEEFRSEAHRLSESGERLYFAIDGHWTPAGHRLAARLIAESIGELP